MKQYVALALLILLLFSLPLAQAQESSTDGKSRAELEAELADLERQIEEQQKQVTTYKTQGASLKNEINSLNSRITKLNLQIKALDLTIEKVGRNIVETQRSITGTERKIDIHKDALTQAVRNLYEQDQEGLVEILLKNKELSDFFGSMNEIARVQTNLRLALEEIVGLRENLVTQKNELELDKEDNENLRTAQQSQKKGVQSTQKEKADILKVTKGKESEYQKLLEKSKETAAQIRGRIFQLLGGGELTFEKAYEFAKLAEKATGVRAAFILAILNQESAFGRNVGQCQYNEIHPKTGVTVMRSRDIPIFEGLLSRLGIDKTSRAAYVSCPIVRDGAHGGAMGPAQFIPSTWKLYESAIEKVTGSNPPNPWNNADAFAGTALYLKDSLSSASCRNYVNENKHIADTQVLIERCAASQYYSGGRWYTYRWVYGEPVVQKTQKFQADINVLESS
ncbi:MAG: lytic murein transglycosylase [Nanoarchaeota archaeon]|nr:lytic murein transglycosylase [Nanoarchaeota archaeon]